MATSAIGGNITRLISTELQGNRHERTLTIEANQSHPVSAAVCTQPRFYYSYGPSGLGCPPWRRSYGLRRMWVEAQVFSLTVGYPTMFGKAAGMENDGNAVEACRCAECGASGDARGG
jgi:hypothetical protein